MLEVAVPVGVPALEVAVPVGVPALDTVVQVGVPGADRSLVEVRGVPGVPVSERAARALPPLLAVLLRGRVAPPPEVVVEAVGRPPVVVVVGPLEGPSVLEAEGEGRVVVFREQGQEQGQEQERLCRAGPRW